MPLSSLRGKFIPQKGGRACEYLVAYLDENMPKRSGTDQSSLNITYCLLILKNQKRKITAISYWCKCELSRPWTLELCDLHVWKRVPVASRETTPLKDCRHISTPIGLLAITIVSSLKNKSYLEGPARMGEKGGKRISRESKLRGSYQGPLRYCTTYS